ncbi:MAG: cytochrome c4 [Arenimonas sp.]|uniref:c-type cytochrome n=1 Tax=Arenimonas sp. TaxID=1872635 RepID=UPI0025C656E1|nr:c-type cytochrome [Arenimonas sp.]MBW8367895.1 cytochrome c4 [Arenimonas sp.]
MKFTRILGVAAALAAASVMAQEAATVTPAPETQAAPVATLEADNTPATFGDAAAGATKAAACAACHGVDGNAATPLYPKLAGQHESYIARQLALYKNGGRDNAIMLGFASALSAQDMRDIGAYFATQKVVPGIADDSLVASGPNQGRKFYQVGEKLFRAGRPAQGIPACQACHGPTGAGVPGPYPAIGGQHADYTALQLTAFRAGAVWGKDKDANAVMAGVAANLSDEDIQGLATYLQGLHNVADAPSAEALAEAAAAAPAPVEVAPTEAAPQDAAPADAAAPEAAPEAAPQG